MELIIKFALVRCMKPKRCSLQLLRMQHTNPKVEKEKNLEFTRKLALDQHHNNSSQMLFFSKENKLILLNEKNLQKLNNKGESKEQEVIPLDNNSSDDIKTSTSVFLTANSDKKEVASTSSSETTYSDDEPLDIGQKNLIQRDLNNPSLWYTDEIELKKLPKHYLMLSKSNLTLLVSLTSAAGYGLACTSMSTASFSPSILVLSTVGVALTSASANTINQILEVPFDSQMVRTRNRVLVRGLISPWHAMGFAVASGIGGSAILWYFVNPLASMLSLFTLILYTSIYTPMKRLSIYNTWVGSIVGAIPPIIGWTSATSQLDVGSLVLAGVLYTWQFPHFNALSWNLRKDYSQAGYRMLSVTDPELCKRVALRQSVGCLLVCSVAAPFLEVTSMSFGIASLPLNAYLIYLSYKFRKEGNSSSARQLFFTTLYHLPLLILLLFGSSSYDCRWINTNYINVRNDLINNVKGRNVAQQTTTASPQK